MRDTKDWLLDRIAKIFQVFSVIVVLVCTVYAQSVSPQKSVDDMTPDEKQLRLRELLRQKEELEKASVPTVPQPAPGDVIVQPVPEAVLENTQQKPVTATVSENIPNPVVIDSAIPPAQVPTNRSGNLASVREVTVAANQSVAASREAALASRKAVAASNEAAAAANQAAVQAAAAAKAAEAARVAVYQNNPQKPSWTGGIIAGVGAGIFIYGLIENANVTSNVNGKRFSKAEDAATFRNAAYIIGGAGILIGIPLQIHHSSNTGR